MKTYQGKEEYFVIEEDELSAFAEKEQINYREKLRTYITGDLKGIKNLTNQELENVSEEKRLSQLTTIILRDKINYDDDLVATAQKLYQLSLRRKK